MRIAFVPCLAAACVFWAAAVHAASVATISNPVPSGAIQIDGNISDWLPLTMYAPDAVGDGSSGGGRPLDIDILQGAVAHDDNFFYFLYRNAADGMVDQFSNWIFFDLDRDTETGYSGTQVGVDVPIGIEFNLGGTEGWNAWNIDATYAGGGTGKTAAAGDSDGSGGTDFIEYAVSRTATHPNGILFEPIGGTSFDLLFWAEDTVPDFYPDNPADWFTYDTTGSFDPGVPGDADGNEIINIQDYLLIQANSFTTVPFGTLGDVNDNGHVDFDDFQEWKTHFPGGVQAAEAAIAAGVPEPASVGLAAGGALVIFGMRRRRFSKA